MGFVYFLEGFDSGLVKIGMTTDLLARLSGLRCHSAESLIALGVLECADRSEARRLERELHERFAHLRVRGEWFDPDTALLTYIAGNTEEHFDDHMEFTAAFLWVQRQRGRNDFVRYYAPAPPMIAA